MTTLTREDLLTLIQQENKPVLTVSREIGIPTTDIWNLIDEYDLYPTYKHQFFIRYNAISKESEKQEHKKWTVENLDMIQTMEEKESLAKGQILPGRLPYKPSVVREHSPDRDFQDNDWEVIEELKSLMSKGKNIGEILRKAGISEPVIELYLMRVEDLDSPERREFLRHGEYLPDEVPTDDSSYTNVEA